MLFNSYIFIFIFLPLTLLGYYLLNHFNRHTLAKAFLVGMSLWFYAYFNIYYLGVISGSLLINYLISLIISRFEKKNSKLTKPWKITFLLAGVFTNLGLLFYFKYFDFFIENVNLLFNSHLRLHNILLPLGISFFTFQQLSYIIDRASSKVSHYNFIDYATFVTFFPQLIAGPIVLHSEILPQLADSNNHKLNSDNIKKGLILFIIGLSKKVLLADVLAGCVNYGFSNVLFLDTTSTLLMMLAYTFQIYFDFSGYSDMAIGLGLLFNIKLPINFNSPYKACNVKELWQRWHITLSRFFVQYVYIPLGGSKKGRIRTLINIFLIFFLSGVWHGANWTYIAWGTMQGLLVVWDNLCIIGIKGQEYKKQPKIMLPRFLGWFFTFGFFNLSLLFFGSSSISDSLQLFKDILSFQNTGHVYKLAASLNIPEFYVVTKAVSLLCPQYNDILKLIILLIMLVISAIVISGKNAVSIADNIKDNKRSFLLPAILFVWCVISFSQVSTFIYFNF